MINGHNLGQLIELAFDYDSGKSEQQAAQIRDEAAKLANRETTTFKVWLELTEYIKAWNGCSGHKYPMSWATALLFLSTRQAEWESSPTGLHKENNS